MKTEDSATSGGRRLAAWFTLFNYLCSVIMFSFPVRAGSEKSSPYLYSPDVAPSAFSASLLPKQAMMSDESNTLDSDKYRDSLSAIWQAAQNNGLSQAMINKLQKEGEGRINRALTTEVENWLKKSGGRVNLSATPLVLEGDAQFGLDFLYPLMWEQDTLFIQTNLHRWNDRHIVNLGLGWRHNLSTDLLLGANLFYDYDLSRNHSRLGAGTEFWGERFRGSVNFYHPLSDWKRSNDDVFNSDSMSYDLYERAAKGLDAVAETGLTQFLSLQGTLFHWRGDKVDVHGSRNEATSNPWGASLKLRWQPVPLFRVDTEYTAVHDQRSNLTAGLGLEWQFGRSLSWMLDPWNAQALPNLIDARDAFVQRNNNIVLEYQERRKETLAVEEPAPPEVRDVAIHGNAAIPGETLEGSYKKVGDWDDSASALTWFYEGDATRALATGSTYNVKEEDFGHTLVFQVEPIDDKGNSGTPESAKLKVVPLILADMEVAVSGGNASVDPENDKVMHIRFIQGLEGSATISAKVLDDKDQPIAGRTVWWTMAQGEIEEKEAESAENVNGVLEAEFSTTDDKGIASVRITGIQKPGIITVASSLLKPPSSVAPQLAQPESLVRPLDLVIDIVELDLSIKHENGEAVGENAAVPVGAEVSLIATLSDPEGDEIAEGIKDRNIRFVNGEQVVLVTTDATGKTPPVSLIAPEVIGEGKWTPRAELLDAQENVLSKTEASLELQRGEAPDLGGETKIEIQYGSGPLPLKEKITGGNTGELLFSLDEGAATDVISPEELKKGQLLALLVGKVRVKVTQEETDSATAPKPFFFDVMVLPKQPQIRGDAELDKVLHVDGKEAGFRQDELDVVWALTGTSAPLPGGTIDDGKASYEIKDAAHVGKSFTATLKSKKDPSLGAVQTEPSLAVLTRPVIEGKLALGETLEVDFKAAGLALPPEATWMLKGAAWGGAPPSEISGEKIKLTVPIEANYVGQTLSVRLREAGTGREVTSNPTEALKKATPAGLKLVPLAGVSGGPDRLLDISGGIPAAAYQCRVEDESEAITVTQTPEGGCNVHFPPFVAEQDVSVSVSQEETESYIAPAKGKVKVMITKALISPSKSSFKALPYPADGKATSELTVTLRDEYDNPVKGIQLKARDQSGGEVSLIEEQENFGVYKGAAPKGEEARLYLYSLYNGEHPVQLATPNKVVRTPVVKIEGQAEWGKTLSATTRTIDGVDGMDFASGVEMIWKTADEKQVAARTVTTPDALILALEPPVVMEEVVGQAIKVLLKSARNPELMGESALTDPIPKFVAPDFVVPGPMDGWVGDDPKSVPISGGIPGQPYICTPEDNNLISARGTAEGCTLTYLALPNERKSLKIQVSQAENSAYEPPDPKDMQVTLKQVDANNSKFELSSPTIVAGNEASTSTIRLRLKDIKNNPITGRGPVTVSYSRHMHLRQVGTAPPVGTLQLAELAGEPGVYAVEFKNQQGLFFYGFKLPEKTTNDPGLDVVDTGLRLIAVPDIAIEGKLELRQTIRAKMNTKDVTGSYPAGLMLYDWIVDGKTVKERSEYLILTPTVEERLSGKTITLRAYRGTQAIDPDGAGMEVSVISETTIANDVDIRHREYEHVFSSEVYAYEANTLTVSVDKGDLTDAIITLGDNNPPNVKMRIEDGKYKVSYDENAIGEKIHIKVTQSGQTFSRFVEIKIPFEIANIITRTSGFMGCLDTYIYHPGRYSTYIRNLHNIVNMSVNTKMWRTKIVIKLPDGSEKVVKTSKLSPDPIKFISDTDRIWDSDPTVMGDYVNSGAYVAFQLVADTSGQDADLTTGRVVDSYLSKKPIRPYRGEKCDTY